VNHNQLRITIDKVVRSILVVLMTVIVLDVLLQVISRYLFKSPLGFTDELAGYLLIWVGLLGAAYATGERQHLAIDLISQKFNPTHRKYLEIGISLCIVAFTVSVLGVGGIWLVYTSFLFGQISAAMEVPLGFVYLIVPISGILIVYYVIDNTIIYFKTSDQLTQ
jgi:TRAP-type C4-dicarboxylate transport system permease small subunit